MGFQIEICPILRVFWSILVKFCVYLPMSSSKTQTLHLEKSIFHKYWLFCSKFFAFTFDLCAFCLLSVIRKQQLKQCNYSVDQSVLLTGFRTDFTSSVWNFCHWVADVPPRETSPAAKSEEKLMFSQAMEYFEQQPIFLVLFYFVMYVKVNASQYCIFWLKKSWLPRAAWHTWVGFPENKPSNFIVTHSHSTLPFGWEWGKIFCKKCY